MHQHQTHESHIQIYRAPTLLDYPNFDYQWRSYKLVRHFYTIWPLWTPRHDLCDKHISNRVAYRVSLVLKYQFCLHSTMIQNLKKRMHLICFTSIRDGHVQKRQSIYKLKLPFECSSKKNVRKSIHSCSITCDCKSKSNHLTCWHFQFCWQFNFRELLCALLFCMKLLCCCD